LANKGIEFDKSYLIQKLNLGLLFSTIEFSDERTFDIPICINCKDLIRIDDLEVIAIGE